MPFGLSRRRNRMVGMSEKICCMVLRLNIDCDACCRKLRRIVLRMKEIETHMIEKPQRRIVVCGRFVPSDVAIKIRKKMNRRVEILEVQELSNEGMNNDQNNEENNDQPTDHQPPPPDQNYPTVDQNNNSNAPNPNTPVVVYPGQAPSFQFQQGMPMPMAYCKREAYSTSMGIAQVLWPNSEDELLPCHHQERIMGIEMPSWENYLHHQY
ncbi:heavy metal-associated isoprenylated plant protein 6 [Senna tora]|uniref:Heavy metal-associated isoprenylated plant protein 6 n=1 Tax=Senna tora TaxID=362788 RepID=A0A834SS53_9FABA|nr:heavy metal-associated isoprenylated plant protein 6 [Senna tora]